MNYRLVVVVGLAACIALSGEATASQASGGDSHATFTVGTATVQRGAKATGIIAVPAGSDAGTNIPVAVVHGAKPGPVLALVAGVHGTEYASIIALEKLIGLLDPAPLSGTVIIVPLINVASFQQMVPHVNPIDRKSMSRYPGDMNGTQSDRVAFVLAKQVVEQCDYLIDMHGGDLDESLRPISYWTPQGKEKQDATSRDMVLAFGTDTIIITSAPKDPTRPMSIGNMAATHGKPTIVVEAGHAGTVETDDMNVLINGAMSIMRYLKMMPGQPSAIDHPVWIERMVTIASTDTGVFYPLVKRGSFVAKDEKTGYVTDHVGKVLFDARAPEAGVVLFVRAVPTANKGDSLALVGVVRNETK
jgi:uncharacterized protein